MTKERLVRITFYGALADSLGRSSWALAVKSPAEALQAIDANTKGALLTVLGQHWQDNYFVAVNGKYVQAIEEMTIMEHGNLETIEFFPIVSGAGNSSGGFMILAGILLIALIVVAPYAAPGLGVGLSTAVAGGAVVTATGAAIGTLVVGVGLSLVMAGIASMLAPSNDFKEQEKPENLPSYLFSGAVNTYHQGNPVPVGFGRLVVGSQIIAAGVRAVNIDTRY